MALMACLLGYRLVYTYLAEELALWFSFDLISLETSFCFDRGVEVSYGFGLHVEEGMNKRAG